MGYRTNSQAVLYAPCAGLSVYVLHFSHPRIYTRPTGLRHSTCSSVRVMRSGERARGRVRGAWGAGWDNSPHSPKHVILNMLKREGREGEKESRRNEKGETSAPIRLQTPVDMGTSCEGRGRGKGGGGEEEEEEETPEAVRMGWLTTHGLS